MGYPMTHRRIVYRNNLLGGYDGVGNPDEDGIGAPQWTQMDPERFHGWARKNMRPEVLNRIAGDIRRLEADQRDERHIAEYAKRASVTPEQAKAVLDAFFEGDF
jgi:hypothetical protein